MLRCSIWSRVRCRWCRARHHPHRTHDLRSGSQDHNPSKNSVQKPICCNSTSNAPDDGRTYPKHVELRIHQQNYLVASSWHFTLLQTLYSIGRYTTRTDREWWNDRNKLQIASPVSTLAKTWKSYLSIRTLPLHQFLQIASKIILMALCLW